MKKYIALLLSLILGIITFIFFKNAIAFMVVLFFAVLIPFVYFKAKDDILDIGLAFILIYSIYIIGIPLKVALGFSETNPMFYLTNVNILVYKMIFYSGVCAIVPFIIGYELPRCIFSKKDKKTNIKYSISKKFIHVLSNIFIFSGIMLFFYGIYTMGGVAYLAKFYIWNENNKLGLGLLTTGYQFFSVGILIEFYFFITSIKESSEKLNVLKWKYFYITVFMLIAKFYQGNRLPALMFLISMFVIYNYSYKRIKSKNIVILLCAGLLLFGYVGLFRTSKKLIPGNFFEIINYVFAKSMNYETYFNSYTVLTTLYITTIFNSRYLYGLTIIDGLLYLIPRFIYSGKDEILFTTSWMNSYSNITNVSPVGGLNLAAQNIMNGGIIFTIVFMFTLGVVLRYLNEMKNNSKYGVLFFAMCFPIVTLSLTRNPNFLVIKEFLTFALIPYLLILLLQTDFLISLYRKIRVRIKKSDEKDSNEFQ